MMSSSNPRLKSWVSFFVIAFSIWVQAQTKTNLDVFKVLIGESINHSFKHPSDSNKDIFLNLKLGSSYQVFEDQIYYSVNSLGRKISNANDRETNEEFSYTLETANVSYGELSREGIVGDYFVPRKISISGSFRFGGVTPANQNFYFENVDTVKFQDIQSLENNSYPFTKGEIPPEPFLSNLFEPIVAIAAAAVVITLFFTVRSK